MTSSSNLSPVSSFPIILTSDDMENKTLCADEKHHQIDKKTKSWLVSCSGRFAAGTN
jgi:hypothetical protein